MSAPIRPLPRPAAVPPAAIVVAPLVPLVRLARVATAAGSTFRARLITALRGLARIEGRVAYEADAMDRWDHEGGDRGRPAARADADGRLAAAREGGS